MITTLDFQILDWIQAHLACGVLDTLMPLITNLGDAGVFWILLTVALLAFPRTRKLGWAMAASLLIDLLLCNLIIKPLAARPRPFSLREVTLLIPPPTDYSFPSGHTAASFAAAAALFFSRSRGWIPAAALAALIGFTRLYLYVHYPSDVLAGLLLGILCGFSGTILAKKVGVFCNSKRK